MAAEQALQQIESGLAGAQQAMLQGDLERMEQHLVQVLDALAAVAQAGLVARQEKPPVPWDGERALQLVLDVLARLHAAGCHGFPYAGTLLGLERDGRLLPNDKDADLAVWLEDFALAGRVLEQLGLRRASDVPPFANVATFVEPRTGYTVDLFGLFRNAAQARVEGGAWLHGRPPGWQRWLLLPWFDLVLRTTSAGPVWWPSDPAALLQAFYGDWRTPQPQWDSLVSNRALAEVNLNWRCFALKNLAQAWLADDRARTRSVLAQVIARAGEDQALRRWREALGA